jgi:hypothetical protein
MASGETITMHSSTSVSNLSIFMAFLIGVLLLIAFGQDWLALESIIVFLAGLIGVAVAALTFGIVVILRNSRHK